MPLLTDNLDPKIMEDYQLLRRRQAEVINDLLSVLPKVDNLKAQYVQQVRDAQFHADHPFLMVFVGAFSSGKSSLINALLGQPALLRIGPTPTTDHISILRYGDNDTPLLSPNQIETVFYPSPLLEKISIVDTPGLESIFKQHEETTQNFLHRADSVIFVMLATQAMTQGNLETLQMFKAYGKKVILVVNQSDLLDDLERETVRTYVTEQSRNRLGFTPEVWMVSAKWGLEAQATPTRDEALWQKSGLEAFERYINGQLNDLTRVRQKLQTPLQIAKTAQMGALDTLSHNQEAFDGLRRIYDNVQAQLEAQRQDLLKTVRDVNAQIDTQFQTAIERSQRATREQFALSNGLRAFGAGFVEVLRSIPLLGRLFSPAPEERTMARAFQKHETFTPLDNLHSIVGTLAPRLESQDQKDLNDLVRYSQRELNTLPAYVQEKMIGALQAPATYDRTYFANLQTALKDEETKARATEPYENMYQNAVLYLWAWVMLLVVLFVALLSAWGAINTSTEAPASWITAGILVLLFVLGFVLMPLHGRALHNKHAHALQHIRTDYIKQITHASDAHIAYAMQLRNDTLTPVTRLVQTQIATQEEQRTRLNHTSQALTQLENDVSALGKRKILGMTF